MTFTCNSAFLQCSDNFYKIGVLLPPQGFGLLWVSYLISSEGVCFVVGVVMVTIYREGETYGQRGAAGGAVLRAEPGAGEVIGRPAGHEGPLDHTLGCLVEGEHPGDLRSGGGPWQEREGRERVRQEAGGPGNSPIMDGKPASRTSHRSHLCSCGLIWFISTVQNVP